MDLGFSDDQAALREMLDDFFAKESSLAVLRGAEPLGFDDRVWRRLSDIGIPVLAVPERSGGGGGGLVDLGIAAELLGRSLAPVPLIEAAVASILLAEVSAIPGLDEIVSGDLIPTVALHPAEQGVARFVPAGAVADIVVALDGDDLVVVRQETKPSHLLNLGAVPLAHCPLEGGTAIASGARANLLHREAVDRWKALTSIALYGVGQKSLEIGLDYVSQRKAFGVPIAVFQTIAHRLADNATALVGSRLIGYEAAWAHDAGRPEAGHLATMAFIFNAQTAFKTASESLHFHGGYGYTLEYDIQLYFRRAKCWPLLAGDLRASCAALARELFNRED